MSASHKIDVCRQSESSIVMTSFSTFKDLPLHEDLHRALDKMGFLEPTPIQQQTITTTLLGRDVLGCAQTGTGKTGAFGIPLIQFLLTNPDKKALILAPTRELADQINRTLQQMAFFAYDLKIALIIGGASMGQQVRALSQGARVVVATPGRLIDLLNQRKIALGNVGVLVLDEVDRMLDMGFAPQLQQIVPHLPKERQAMLFSATLPQEIMKIAESYLRNPVRVTVGDNTLTAAVTIEQKMIQTQQDSKQHLLLKELVTMPGKMIVFVRTQHGTERLAKVVRAAGYRADRLHGGRTQVQRKRALDNFRKGEVQILVATDIAGRGIDIDDIEYVINYDMPKTHEDYIHRIGRTGRYGRKGIALNFVTYEDLSLMRMLDPESYPSRRGPSSGGPAQGGRGRGPRAEDRRPQGRRGPPQGGDRRDARPAALPLETRRDGPNGSAPRTERRPQVAAAAAAPQAPRPPRRPQQESFDATNSKIRRGEKPEAKAGEKVETKSSRLAKLFRWE